MSDIIIPHKTSQFASTECQCNGNKWL